MARLHPEEDKGVPFFLPEPTQADDGGAMTGEEMSGEDWPSTDDECPGCRNSIERCDCVCTDDGGAREREATCKECDEGIAVDEDGCCISCGEDRNPIAALAPKADAPEPVAWKPSWSVVEEAAKDSGLYNSTVQSALNELKQIITRTHPPSVEPGAARETANELLKEVVSIVRKDDWWEITEESLRRVIFAALTSGPAAIGGELIKEAVEKAYAHGYAKGHLNGLDDIFRPFEAAKAYADDPPKWIKELYAPASPEGETTDV